jgi:hypothetical protein
MSKRNNQAISVEHLDDYVKCPNYAKYNWNNHKIKRQHYLYQPLREIIRNAYKDQANLEKKIAWRNQYLFFP